MQTVEVSPYLISKQLISSFSNLFVNKFTWAWKNNPIIAINSVDENKMF